MSFCSKARQREYRNKTVAKGRVNVGQHEQAMKLRRITLHSPFMVVAQGLQNSDTRNTNLLMTTKITATTKGRKGRLRNGTVPRSPSTAKSVPNGQVFRHTDAAKAVEPPGALGRSYVPFAFVLSWVPCPCLLLYLFCAPVSSTPPFVTTMLPARCSLRNDCGCQKKCHRRHCVLQQRAKARKSDDTMTS